LRICNISSIPYEKGFEEKTRKVSEAEVETYIEMTVPQLSKDERSRKRMAGLWK